MTKVDRRKMTKTVAAASAAVPRVRAVMSDVELRGEVRDLLDAAGSLYGELGKERRLHTLATDRRIRKDVDQIVKTIRHTGRRLGKEQRHRNRGRYVLIGGLAGSTAAVLIYPRTRQRIVGAVRGGRGTSAAPAASVEEKAA